MSFGEAFLHVSALMTIISMPLELSIRNRPSEVKSMPTMAPDTWWANRGVVMYINNRYAMEEDTGNGFRAGGQFVTDQATPSARQCGSFRCAMNDKKHLSGV